MLMGQAKYRKFGVLQIRRLNALHDRGDMSLSARYRAKAQELKAKAQGDENRITRAALDNFALSYVRLAEQEEKHQREKAWSRLPHENGWRCECGHSISYGDRAIYFRTGLCAHCYRGLKARREAILTELHHLCRA
jgi:hypothetical protein